MPGRPNTAAEKLRQRLRRFAELREHQHLLLLRRDRLRRSRAAARACRCPLAPRAVAQPVRRMIADLLEAHEERRGSGPCAGCPRPRSRDAAASSFTDCWYSAACLRARPQNAFISVLSGRSAITVLSVFSRRRIYGRTSSRSGAYASCSRLASRLANVAEFLPAIRAAPDSRSRRSTTNRPAGSRPACR